MYFLNTSYSLYIEIQDIVVVGMESNLITQVIKLKSLFFYNGNMDSLWVVL